MADNNQLQDYKQLLESKWQELEQRERVMLSVGGVLVILILFYSFVWSPMRQSIYNYHALLPNKRADLMWMQSQADNYKKTKQTSRTSNKPLLTIIEETAQQAGLREQIQQMSPGDNNNEVRVWLSETSFDEWVKWIDSLSRQHGVSINTANIQKDEEKLVDIRVSFGR